MTGRLKTTTDPKDQVTTYTDLAVGNVMTWRQQADSGPAVLWSYEYDAADQLTGAVKASTGGPPTVLGRYAYAYDAAGNRTSERIDDQVTSATHDALNRLQAQVAGGPMPFAGTLSEPAAVTIEGMPATVDASNAFRGSAPIASGANTVTVVATDPNGNVAMQQYQLTGAGANRTFAYDANGNLTSDDTRTFEWDARNQLVAINEGTHRSEFGYDGEYRRVRIVEKENSAVVSDDRFVWDRNEIAERRDASGAVVTA